MNQLAMLLVLGLFCCGCGATKQTPATTQADITARASSDTIPIIWTQITLNNFQPLIKLQQAGDSTEFSFKLSTGQEGDRVLYFGEIKNGDDQLMPIVAQRAGKQFVAVKMQKTLGYDQWQQVVSGPRNDEIWGFFDQSEENQTHEMTLIHSLDGGQTLRLAVMRKPCKEATFYDFVMAKNGSGRLTLGLAKDCNSGIKAGLYHYKTTNGGLTWSRPEYEPDATQPSEDVPDDEQPSEQGQMSALAR
jgi:hypothetical protein